MAQYHINLNSEILHHLFQNDEGLARLLEQVLNQVLQAQLTEQLHALPYERTEERKGYRNGYYPRKLTTRVGTLTLHVPRARTGEFSTELFLRYQRSEQALVLALMEMVINGVSTRKVAKITEELCGTEFSKSTVSDLCKRLDPIIQAWNQRELEGSLYPFLLVDALVIKVRENERVRSRSILIAIGINEKGYREILGLRLGDSESEDSWTDFFAWLKQRGLKGVDLVVSDHHVGLINAIKSQFQGCTWQRCQTHFLRNILNAAPNSLQAELAERIRAILHAPDLKTARMLRDQVLADYEEKAPKAMAILEEGFDDATAVLVLPERYRKRLRTTNMVERLIEEIRRRENVIRIFPNRESAVRLIGAILMETDEKWSTGRMYLHMAEYWEWRKQQVEQMNEEKAVSIRQVS